MCLKLKFVIYYIILWLTKMNWVFQIYHINEDLVQKGRVSEDILLSDLLALSCYISYIPYTTRSFHFPLTCPPCCEGWCYGSSGVALQCCRMFILGMPTLTGNRHGNLNPHCWIPANYPEIPQPAEMSTTGCMALLQWLHGCAEGYCVPGRIITDCRRGGYA